MNQHADHEKDQDKPGLRHRVPHICGVNLEKDHRVDEMSEFGRKADAELSVIDRKADVEHFEVSNVPEEAVSVINRAIDTEVSEVVGETEDKHYTAPSVRKISLPIVSANESSELESVQEIFSEKEADTGIDPLEAVLTTEWIQSEAEHRPDDGPFRESPVERDLLPERPAHRRFDPALSEEVLSVDPRFIGRVFSVEVQDVKLPDGRQSKREIVRHPGGACVVALDSEQHLYLVRQHRVGTGGPTREIPAGKLDLPEAPIDCARRELTEETGLVAERWDLLTRFYPSPGYTDETISIYLARGLSKGFAKPDDGEFISVERIHLTEALNQIREGLITDGKTCLGIYMAADLIGYFS